MNERKGLDRCLNLSPTETLIERGFSVRALVHRQDERSEKLRSTGAEITIGDMLDLNHDNPPLVIDPFAGGGSIPLEALWLGCEAFASDLNPVACLILKVLLEDIPRHGVRLAANAAQLLSDMAITSMRFAPHRN